MKPETINSKAYELSKHGEVSARVAALRQAVADKGLWTREKSVTALSNIAEGSDKGAEIVAAVKELNAMHGFNAPTKHELNISFPKTINVIAGRA